LQHLNDHDFSDGQGAGQLAQRLQAAEGLAGRARQRLAIVSGSAPEGVSSVSLPAEAAGGQSLYLSASGEVSQLTLHPAQAVNSRTVFTRLAASLLVGLALVTAGLARLNVAQEWLAAHAHLVLALAGLLWWLIAPLGWLGWLAVLAALLVSLRFP
jgi:hypothetical protein